jgi:hypothetical protein
MTRASVRQSRGRREWGRTNTYFRTPRSSSMRGRLRRSVRRLSEDTDLVPRRRPSHRRSSRTVTPSLSPKAAFSDCHKVRWSRATMSRPRGAVRGGAVLTPLVEPGINLLPSGGSRSERPGKSLPPRHGCRVATPCGASAAHPWHGRSGADSCRERPGPREPNPAWRRARLRWRAWNVPKRRERVGRDRLAPMTVRSWDTSPWGNRRAEHIAPRRNV